MQRTVRNSVESQKHQPLDSTTYKPLLRQKNKITSHHFGLKRHNTQSIEKTQNVDPIFRPFFIWIPASHKLLPGAFRGIGPDSKLQLCPFPENWMK